MVVLNRIYTRTGDDGTTALGTGERRPKYDLRIAAYGTVDETNAVIGVARLHLAATPELDAMLGRHVVSAIQPNAADQALCAAMNMISPPTRRPGYRSPGRCWPMAGTRISRPGRTSFSSTRSHRPCGPRLPKPWLT